MQSIAASEQTFPGADGQPLPMAIYRPPAPIADPPPAVVIIEGYPDPGFAKFLGCRFMDMAWSISMAQLIAASGVAAITYANCQPSSDAAAVLEYVKAKAGTLGLDGTRLGFYATSGHAPVALSVLDRARCAVLSNPFTFDINGATHVADASKMFRFEAPIMNKIASDKPLFVIRSGKDEMPGLNASLDHFVTHALAANHSVRLVNHPDAPHSFDVFHDSDATRRILREALAFLRDELQT
jgi:hypothetical protein